MEVVVIWIFAGLMVKHFVADYVLQWPAMIHDKLHIGRPGGYIHAGIHVTGTCLVLFIAGISFSVIWKIMLAEFAVHFTTDHLKARYSASRAHSVHSSAYWVAHGFDQLVHSLTYVVIVAALVSGIAG